MKIKPITLVLLIMMLAIIASCAPGTVGQISTATPNPDADTLVTNGQIYVPAVSIQVNAPSPNPLTNTPNPNGHVAGILLGIWHGIISPITLIVSLIDRNVQMYDVYNDGSQYNFGFFLGAAIMYLLLGALIGSSRR